MAELAGVSVSSVCVAGVFLVAGAACDTRDADAFGSGSASASVSASATDGNSVGDTSGNDTTGGADNGTDGDDDDSIKLDVAGADDESGNPIDDGEDCAEVSEVADVGLQPADIIVVVDNSGSMSFEAAAVQNNMNAFSSQIFLANIDAHVVLISSYPTDDDAGICVSEPLGAGGCPLSDTNLPTFQHVNAGVGSNNALERVISLWPDYEDIMRPTAARHVVVVTDDDSDLSATDFDAMFKALDATNAEYTLHAIAAPEDPATACLLGTSCCLTSADDGAEYLDLVMATGGVWGNLCDQDFQPVFDQLSMAVISGATLACEFAIPTPPEGETLNPDEVNVEFDDGQGGGLQIGRVDSAADCAAVDNGWYYDDPDAPTTILVCPQTCDVVQGFTMASVSIKFGCATIPAG